MNFLDIALSTYKSNEIEISFNCYSSLSTSEILYLYKFTIGSGFGLNTSDRLEQRNKQRSIYSKLQKYSHTSHSIPRQPKE